MESIHKFYIYDASDSKIDKITSIFIFISMVLIGSDRISIHVGGITLRLVQLILVAAVLIMFINKKFATVDLIFFSIFLGANVLSTLFSHDLKSSVLYIIWTIYNYVAVYLLFFSWSRNKKKEYVIDFWILSFIVQTAYVFIQYIMGLFKVNDPFFSMQVFQGVYRPAIWFYEPSYLATYFSVFLAISLFLYINIGKKLYRNSMMLSYFSLLIISSSTGYLSIALAVAGTFAFSIFKLDKKKLKRLGITLISMLLILCFTYTFNSNRLNVFVGRMLPKANTSQNAKNSDSQKDRDKKDFINEISDSQLVKSSGGRVNGWKDAFKVFRDHPIVGIGPNAYPKYSKTNVPPTNVTLEVLANLGIVGFAAFSIFILAIIIRSLKNIKKMNYYQIALIISFLIFAIVLQANQNYLRLYMWMQLGIISGCCYSKNKISE